MRRTRALPSLVVMLLALGLSNACSSFGEAASVQDAGTGDGFSADAGLVGTAAGCDGNADPKDAEKCVADEVATFVSAQGSEGAVGTKDQPLRTIGAGLALAVSKGKSRVYVCEGSYGEHVKVTSGVTLVGGFACGTWTYSSGAKTTVTPTDAGYALEVSEAKADVIISDLSFVAPNATVKGESSIAAFVHASSKVVVLRSTLEAGAGKEGQDGAAGVPGVPTEGDSNGNPAHAASGLMAGGIKA